MSKIAYRKDIDVLKGVAIIAVVLYHLGLLKSGYLGVDAFFVINGFLVIPSIINKVENGTFSYIDFIKKRLIRLYPLILIATTVSLILGYIGMLPDNYENVAQSVIASNLMSENILSAITTADYWNVANDYNPQMHFWYVGILFEFYLVFPIIMKSVFKLSSGNLSVCKAVLLILTIASLVLYLTPIHGANKFYFLHYRFFEIGIGGITAIYADKLKVNKLWQNIAYGGVFFLLFSALISQDYNFLGCMPIIIGDIQNTTSGLLFPREVLLLCTVILTALCVANDNKRVCCTSLSYLGKMSFSIFVWHQIIIAFYRYFVTNEISLVFIIAYLSVVACVSFISYKLIECRIPNNDKTVIICFVLALFTTSVSAYIYMRAGVVRNVPELNITTTNAHRGMHGEYCDRIYQLDREFEDSCKSKVNVLVIGNSYARDMANVILESPYKDSVFISYIFGINEKYIPRIKKADAIFYFGNTSVH